MVDPLRSKEMRPVLGMGTVVVDHQVFLAALPDADTKSEVLSDRFQVGGPVPTALALLGRMGLSTSFIGKWGMDDWGRMIEDDLSNQGVAAGLSAVHPQFRSGFAHVWVERQSGRRSIAAFRGSHEIEVEDLGAIQWSDYAALHLDGWSTDAAIVAAKEARSHKVITFMDLGSPKPRLEELVSSIDHINCPGRLFSRLYPGQALEAGAVRFLELGARSVSVTDGEQGAWFFDREGSFHQPAFPVEAVDTNGAGDVFSGAMIYTTLLGWAAKRRVRFAAAAAALKCRGPGNRQPLPDRASVDAFLGDRA